MEGFLSQVLKRLASVAPPNEAAVRQSLVLPVLRGLGWDTDDFEQVCYEYSVQGTRVDLALCHPKLKPQIFIEVKQTTSFEQGVEQLLAYAFKHGVRIAVLTDGQRWSFYLPSGAGSFGDRRFHHLDLTHRQESEAEALLWRYLSRTSVASGTAFSDAQADCESSLRQKQLVAALPDAWEALLRDGDEYVSFALAERVEATTGIRPSAEAVEEFLSSLTNGVSVQLKPAGLLPSSRKVGGAQPSSIASGISLDRFWFRVGSAPRQARRTTIALVRDSLIELEKSFPGFLARYEIEARHGRTRRWVTKDRSRLYDERPDLCEEYAEPITSGWWVGTNYSNGEKRKMLDDMKRTASALGIDFEFDIRGSK